MEWRRMCRSDMAHYERPIFRRSDRLSVVSLYGVMCIGMDFRRVALARGELVERKSERAIGKRWPRIETRE